MQNKIDTLPTLSKSLVDEITAAYNFYITNVSLKGHAASLELSLFLYRWCEQNQPKTIVDLGSGFTSYVLRLYKKNHPGTDVTSVDDDANWFKKTEQFLVRQGVDTTQLELWDVFQHTPKKFDLVLYDLGRIPTRIANVDKPFDFIADGGVMVMDDIHFDATYSAKYKIPPPYLGDVLYDAIKRHGVNSLLLKDQTIDDFGRHSILVWK